MFLERLRNETAKQHEALEANAHSVKLMSTDVTLEVYTDYLKKLYGFVHSFEVVALPMIYKNYQNIDSKTKVVLLEDDLRSLNIDPILVDKINTEDIASIYPLPSNALGGLYVMEGSTLGGIYINKHLTDHLGKSVSGKTSYLSVYGEHTGSNWKQFLNWFCDHAVTKEQQQQIIAGAKATFTLMHNWMSR